MTMENYVHAFHAIISNWE